MYEYILWTAGNTITTNTNNKFKLYARKKSILFYQIPK